MNIRCVELHSFSTGQFFLRCDEPMDDEDPITVRLCDATRQLKAWKRIDLKHSVDELMQAVKVVYCYLDTTNPQNVMDVISAFQLLLR